MASSTTSKGAPASVVSLTPSDVGEVRSLAHRCFPEKWSEADILYFLEHPTGLCTGIFHEDGGLVAYLLALLVQGELDIITVATDERYRRRGLARRLLLHAYQRPSVRRVTLEVSTGNAPAIALYESLGFKRDGVRKKYYRGTGDAYLMSLDVR